LKDNYDITAIAIGKELTKRYEQVWHDLDTCLQDIEKLPVIRGEWTMIVKVAPTQEASDIHTQIQALKLKGFSLQQTRAVGEIITKWPRNQIYAEYHKS